MSSSTEYKLASAWLSALGDAASQGNVDGFVSCIAPDGWLRDLLVFTPNIASRRGPQAIAHYISPTLSTNKSGLANFKLDEDPAGAPQKSMYGPTVPVIALAFDFETSTTLGKGHARLYYPKEGEESQGAKALAVMLSVKDWKGHEEVSNESGLYGGHTLSFAEVRAERFRAIEADPQAVILGAGQSGLQTAARFKQNGIRTIVIEQSARIGDVWRDRYPTLALHTPKEHHNFLYAPFPSNWPTYTGRDKLANWMEQYAITQDLLIWTSSTLDPGATYDAETKRWALVVRKNGVPHLLRPKHLILATSTMGDPIIPIYPGTEKFKGTLQHAITFPGGAPFEGKKVLVVGAGNTSVDVCQDLVHKGAQSVTLLQRSETVAISLAWLAATFGGAFPPGLPTYYCDLAFCGMPVGAFKEMGKMAQPFAEGFDKEMHDGLRKAGLKLSAGPDGSGQFSTVVDRFGGHFVDVGCAKLIIEGKVKVKSGAEVAQLNETGVVLTDGSSLECDSIILATGMGSTRDKLRRILGNEMIDRTNEIWGQDEHGEQRSGYRPSGQSGLWFACGDFATTRFHSKILALQIKGIELGHIKA